jgi:hypothetical protein
MLGAGERPSLSQLEAAFAAEIRRCDEFLQRYEAGTTHDAFQRQREAASRLLHAIVPAQQGLPL